MKRLGLWIVMACLIGSAGAEPAKKPPKPKPAIRDFARIYAGQWAITGRTMKTPLESGGAWTGTMTVKPILKGFAVHCTYAIHFEGATETLHLEELLWYDPVRKDLAHFGLGDNGTVQLGGGTANDLSEWEATRSDAKGSHKVRGLDTVAPDGKSFTRKAEVCVDGERWVPHFKATFKKMGEPPSAKTRTKGVTRKHFQEYCRLNEGVWVGKVPLRADMPGVGKKGEMSTAHYEYTLIEDGAGLLGKSYWPEGTNTWLIAYDQENQRIKSLGVSPIFGVDSPTIRYKNRKWTCRERAMNPDGTKYEATITGTFSADGKTMTVTVSGPDGEKVMFTDVWHRMNLKPSK